jgi:tight adherence protein C
MPEFSLTGWSPLLAGLLGVTGVGLWLVATGVAGLIWREKRPALSEKEKVEQEIREEWQGWQRRRRAEQPLYRLVLLERYLRPLTEKQGRLLAGLLSRLELGETARKETERKLDQVYAGRQSLAGWWGQRLTGGLVGLALVEGLGLAGLLEASLLGVGLAFLAGFYLPVLDLNRKVREQQAEITEQLPNFIDLLTIQVQGGAGLEEALRRVARQGRGVLPLAVRRAFMEASSQELLSPLTGPGASVSLLHNPAPDYLWAPSERPGRLRSPLMQALRRMAERYRVRELGDFVAALEMAEAQGVAVSGLLANLGGLMRNKRSTRLAEQGQKLVGRMVFPLVLFILPAFALLLLTPALLQVLAL